MKKLLPWALLAAAIIQFSVTALPPGNDDLISIHSLSFDLARGDDSILYPGANFSRNDEWIAHHEANLRKLGDSGQPNWCFYPPLIPYLAISFAQARADSWRLIWGALQIVFVILFALLIERLLRNGGAPANRVLIFAMVVGSFPVARSVELGQTSLLIALLIWCGIFFAQTGRQISAVVLTGIAIFVKPFLFVITAVDAARRQWWDAAGYTTVWLLLLLISLAAVGVYAHLEYWNLLSTLGKSQTAFYGNQSLLGGLFRIFSDLPVTDYGFWANPKLVWLGRVIAVLILGAAGWAQFSARAPQPILSYGLWLSAAALALPISWEHHLVFVLPSLAFLWTQSKTRAEWITLILITALIEVRWTFLYGDDLSGRFAANLPLMSNMILFVYLLKYHRKMNGRALVVPAAKESDVRA